MAKKEKPKAEKVTKEVEVVNEVKAEAVTEAEVVETKDVAEVKTEAKTTKKVRSHKYTKARSQVDKTKNYPLAQAVELLKKTSYSKFVGTVSVDAIVRDQKLNTQITFPHSTGKSVRVAIANETTIAELESGNINFDVLVASPDMMPKIAKYARVLGPKGLMPNPKNGTVSPNPEKRAKELSNGSVRIKTEKKDPLIHVTIGKTNQPDQELIDNISHLIKIIDPRSILKLVITSTMAPGIKVDVSAFIAA